MPSPRCLLFILFSLPPALAWGDDPVSPNSERSRYLLQPSSSEQKPRNAARRIENSHQPDPRQNTSRFVSSVDQDNAANGAAQVGEVGPQTQNESTKTSSSALDHEEENLLTLSPPSSKTGKIEAPKPPSTTKAITTVVGSLAVVLPLFFLVVWVSRRMTPKGSMILPEEVVEQLGRAPLSGRQSLHLVRVGRKLLLLSITPTGSETLTEISDSEEVDHLVGLCRQQHPNSISESFKQVLTQFGEQPAPGGFLGDDRTDLELADV